MTIALALFVVPHNTGFSQVYTHTLYPFIAALLVPLTGSVNLPVTLLLAVLIVLLLTLVSYFNRQRPRGLKLAGHIVWGAALAAASLYALFFLLWGFNYSRTSVAQALNLSSAQTPSTLEDIMLAEALGNIIRQHESSKVSWQRDLNDAKAALKEVVDQLEHRKLTLPRYVKKTPKGFLLATGRATGLMVPWTLEPYVEDALPESLQLATALHELAHVAGYAGEAEADFMMALAGLTSDNPSLQYATALYLFPKTIPPLVPERRAPTYEDLPKRSKRELRALADAYTRYSAPAVVQKLQTGFYNQYLKSNQVKAGTADYDRVVLLLKAAQRDGLIEFDWEDTVLHADAVAQP